MLNILSTGTVVPTIQIEVIRMQNYSVVKAEKAENRIITHILDMGNGETKTVQYSDVRAGLSWPTPTSPGYYCILGEEHHEINKYEGVKRTTNLKLLSEREFPGISLDELFAKLTDDTSLLRCSRIFTDMSDEYDGYVELFREFVIGIKHSGYLNPAPYTEVFFLGVSRILDWTKSGKLDIPEKTFVHSQLKGITKADLADSPETIFYAVNALRFVVGAFFKHRPINNPPFRPNRSKRRF